MPLHLKILQRHHRRHLKTAGILRTTTTLRLAQQLRQGAAENRQPQQNADLYENIPVHALLPDSLTRAADAALNSVQANRSDDAVADQYTRRSAGND